MRHSQRGITFIGWLFLLIPVAIVVYAGIRLAPIYLNYMRVSKSLSQLATEAKSGSTTNPQAAARDAGEAFRHREHRASGTKDIDIHREGDHLVGGRRLRGCGAVVRQHLAAGAVSQAGRHAVTARRPAARLAQADARVRAHRADRLRDRADSPQRRRCQQRAAGVPGRCGPESDHRAVLFERFPMPMRAP